MIKILFFPIGAPPVVHDVRTAWDFAKQHLANATLEIVALDDGVEIFCDEEAHMKHLPFNLEFAATAPLIPEGVELIYAPANAPAPGQAGVYRIHGPLILTRPRGLTDADITKYLALHAAQPRPIVLRDFRLAKDEDLLVLVATDQGFEPTADGVAAMLEAFAPDAVHPGICRKCRVVEEACEPDAENNTCGACDEDEVAAIMVLAGLV